VKPVLDGLGLGPLGHRLDPVAKVSIAVNFRARRGCSIRSVLLGPLLKLGLARALIPQLGVFSLKAPGLPHFPHEIARNLHLFPVCSALVNLVPRAVDLLNVALSDVNLFSVYFPRAHPDMHMRVVGVLVDDRKRPRVGKLLL
jgi:hypothetical protein